MGTNPAVVLDGPTKGNEILKEEARLGFALVNSLSAAQLQKALIAEIAPNEMVTSNSRKVMLQKPEGILYTELTPDCASGNNGLCRWGLARGCRPRQNTS